MRHARLYRTAMALTVIALLLTAAGCDRILQTTNSLSMMVGWMIGSVNAPTTTETLCYENGVLINCADLPDDLGE